jgi:hypothetical protein
MKGQHFRKLRAAVTDISTSWGQNTTVSYHLAIQRTQNEGAVGMFWHESTLLARHQSSVVNRGWSECCRV